MFGEVLGQLSIVAAFVKKVIDLVKPAYQETEYQKYIDQGLSVALSAALCLAWGVDALAVAGIQFANYPWIAPVITGVVAGLGANFLNEVLSLLEMWRKQKQAEAKVAKEVAEAVTNEPLNKE